MVMKRNIVLFAGILLLLIIPSANAATPNSCTFGGLYTSKWLNINIIILTIGFIIIGSVYAISKTLPASTSQKIAGITKMEITQLVISIFIIGILISMSSIACNASSNLGNSLLKTSGLNPFQYSEYYVENLSMNTGMNLLSYIYTTGISYAVYAAMLDTISKDITPTSLIEKLTFTKNSFVVTPTGIGYNLSIFMDIMTNLYIDLFSSVLLVMIGMLFVQWLSLPIIQAVAFTLMLPFALILRSIAFASSGGQGLRETANAILAIAIALYLIYPLMIMFNSYAISYIFSPANPLYSCTNCLGSSLTPINIQSGYFNSVESQTPTLKFLGITSPPLNSLISGPLLSNIGLINPLNMFRQIHHVLSGISKFIFMGLFMFGIDLTVTIGFAMSLTKALNSGIEGTFSFWDSV